MTNRQTIDDLDRESAAWVKEGLISEDQRAQILDQHGVFSAPSHRSQKLTATMATLGALLVGVGVILFFASNWEKISPFQKMTLLLIILLGSYILGYRLSTKENGYPRLGTAFYFLGAILYGANIFLVAQAYNINSHWPNGVLWWGVGTLPLAFLLSSRAISALAVVTLSFWMGSELSLALANDSSWFVYYYSVAYGLWGCGLLAVGGWLKHQPDFEKFSPVFQSIGLLLLLSALFVWTFSDTHPYSKPQILLAQAFDGRRIFLAFSLGASAVSLLFLAWSHIKRVVSREELFLSLWILAAGVWMWIAPLFLQPLLSSTAVVGNVVFFFAIIALLYIGYLAQKGFCVNLGLLAFAALVIARYFDFAWKYMERSTAFIVGGVLLLVMGFGLERGRRKLIRRMAP